MENAFNEILRTWCWLWHPGQVKCASGTQAGQSHCELCLIGGGTGVAHRSGRPNITSMIHTDAGNGWRAWAARLRILFSGSGDGDGPAGGPGDRGSTARVFLP